MYPDSNPANPEKSNEPVAERESLYEKPAWKKLYAFILGPSLVAAAAIGVFTTVSYLTHEDSSPADLVDALKNGGEHRRWQAAFALTKYLQRTPTDSDDSYAEKQRSVRVFVPDLIAVFNDPKRGDEQVKRYLALAFGDMGDPALVPLLTNVLTATDSELVIYALRSLGLLRDVSCVPAVIEATKRDDTDIRAIGAYVLGVLGTEEGVARLEALVEDSAPSVRWNSAFALARHKNATGEKVIVEILERGPLYQAVRSDPLGQREQFLNAIRSAGMLRTVLLKERLSRIADSDDDLRARDLAKKQLALEP